MSDKETLLTVIVPIRNEEGILWENLSTVARCLDDEVGVGKWGFALVDNGSTDSSDAIINKLIERFPPSQKFFLPKPNYGSALRTGLTACSTEWAWIIDVEQWDLPFFIWSWRARDHYELFIASKRADPSINKQPNSRRILSWGLNALLQLFFDFSGTESHGSKLLNKSRLATIIEQCHSDRGQYDTEIVLRTIRAGHRVCELPVPYKEHRTARNPIFKKILWNIVAFNRLRRRFADVPYAGPVRIHRFMREDVEDLMLPGALPLRSYDADRNERHDAAG